MSPKTMCFWSFPVCLLFLSLSVVTVHCSIVAILLLILGFKTQLPVTKKYPNNSKMEVFNKYLYQVSSSVSQTVSQLSGVLPGNPVTREYESSAHIASAGPGKQNNLFYTFILTISLRSSMENLQRYQTFNQTGSFHFRFWEAPARKMEQKRPRIGARKP